MKAKFRSVINTSKLACGKDDQLKDELVDTERMIMLKDEIMKKIVENNELVR